MKPFKCTPSSASEPLCWDVSRGAGIAAAEDPERGWDHGVFVPLKLAFPDAQLPVVELSLLTSLDPQVGTCTRTDRVRTMACLACTDVWLPVVKLALLSFPQGGISCMTVYYGFFLSALSG